MTKNIIKSVLVAMALSIATGASAQTATKGQVLKGTVVDNNGNPIVGALVNVTETNRLAMTDKNGCFSLKNVSNGDEICINSEGYYQKIEKANFDGFKVVLERDSDMYEKEFAMPFTTKKMKYITESTSTVTGEELEKHPVTVLQNAFNSVLTGVETYEATSEPGWSETNMYIRGLRTTNATAQHPLVIVDNVERDLSFLDAYPIEKVTVLKDAAASAIYGMKGANGAIIVTTRRGETGKTKINFTQEFGFQTIAGLPESQNAYQYAQTVNQANYLDGNDPTYSAYDLEQYRKVSNGEKLTGPDQYKYFNTNWAKTALRDLAPQLKTNLQISGGTDRVKYYVSFSYLRQEGLYNEEWTKYNPYENTQATLDRFNLRTNVDINLNKFLSMSLDLGGRFDNIKQPTAQSTTTADWRAADTWQIFCQGIAENLPIYPVFCPNGEFFLPNSTYVSKNAAYLISSNGIEYNRRRNLYSTINLIGDFGFLTKGLKGHITYSFDGYDTMQKWQEAEADAYSYDIKGTYYSPEEIAYTQVRTFQELTNSITSGRDYYYNLNMNAGFDYARQFGKHDVSANAFMRTYQHTIRGQYSSYRYASFNFTGTYAYDNRYMLTANVSHMGSDNYARGNRWDTFWGISAGWNLAQEKWLKGKGVDLLKLRASYGRAGYDIVASGSNSQDGATNRYPYQSTYSANGNYGFGTLSGTQQSNYITRYVESTMGSDNIRWEISKMLNVGLDWDLWHRRLYGSIDFFKEWRSDVLVSRSSIPTLLGVTAPQDSYGRIESHGGELMIGHTNRIGQVKYYIEGMLSWNKSKLIDIDEVERQYDYQYRTGHRIGQGFMFKFNQWASDEALIPTSYEDAVAHPEKYPWSTYGTYKLGNAVFVDANGDRQITIDDQIALGYNTVYDPIPELTPSVKIGIEWKGFDARAILTAYLNRTAICRENMDYGFGWGGTSTHAITHTWGYFTDDPNDPRNINAWYPRLSAGGFSPIDRNDDTRTSDIWLVNGDYLSLRNIEVGYSFPRKWISAIGMTKLRLYFSAYNICNWSHLPDGFDPENPTNYVWSYPKTKSFTFGLNVSF